MAQKSIIAQDLYSTTAALSKVDFKSGQTFQGSGHLPIDNFPRLVEEAQQIPSLKPTLVQWKCHTWIDILPDGKLEYRLLLSVETTIPVMCQRCLEDFSQPIQARSQFVLFNSQEEVDEFPLENDDEDALLSSHEFNLLELIEDELLLAIPIVTKHEDENCQNLLLRNANMHSSDDNFTENDQKDGKLNQFLVLKKLKMN